MGDLRNWKSFNPTLRLLFNITKSKVFVSVLRFCFGKIWLGWITKDFGALWMPIVLNWMKQLFLWNENLWPLSMQWKIVDFLNDMIVLFFLEACDHLYLSKVSITSWQTSMVLTGLEEVEDFLKISWITNLSFKIIYNLHSIFGCSSQ